MIQKRMSCGEWVGTILVLLFMLTLALLDGAVQRRAGAVGLPVVMLVLIAAHLLERRALRVVTLCVWGVAILAAAGLGAASFLGVTATGGTIEDSVYHLTHRGVVTEVGRLTYYLVIWLNAVALALWPSGFLLVFMTDDDGDRPS